MQNHFSLERHAVIWNGKTLSFQTLHKIMAQSRWGAVLRSIIRFEQHRPEKEVSPEIWAKTIGANGNDLDHQVRAARIMAKWVNCICTLDRDSKATLVLTEIFHDCGEAATPWGDIHFGNKTTTQAAEELHALRKVLTDIFNQAGYPGLGQHIHAKISPVLDHSNPALTKIHRLLTYSDHFHTALRVWNTAKLHNSEPMLHAGLIKLTYNVFGGTLAWIIENQKFMPIQTMLLKKRLVIEEVFKELNYMPPPVIDLYERQKNNSSIEARLRFINAMRAWDNWTQNNLPILVQNDEQTPADLAFQS